MFYLFVPGKCFLRILYTLENLYISVSIIQKQINIPLILLKNWVNKCPKNLEKNINNFLIHNALCSILAVKT